MNPDFEGVVAGPAITRKTRIDGFRLQGMNGTPMMGNGGVALTISGGSPTVSNNVINGGDIMGAQWPRNRSIGVVILVPTVDPNGALIESNQIKGGTCPDTSHGVLFTNVQGGPMGSAVALVRKNTIRSGNASNSQAVAAWSSGGSAALVDNDIAPGNSMASSGGGGGAWGVAVGSTLLIDGNRINVDPMTGSCSLPTQWCGGIISYSSTATIHNNVVYGAKAPRSAGVMLVEAEVPAGVVILNGNTIDGGGSGPSPQSMTVSAAVSLRIGTCNTCGFKGVFGRIRNNVLQGGQNQNRYGIYEDQVPNKTNKPEALEANDFFFPALQGRTDSFHHVWNGMAAMDLMSPPASNIGGDPQLDPTWHIAKTSPCVDKGVATEAPKNDRDGDPRPNGPAIDIGADEVK
jgi:hypothetical protein